MTLQCGWPGPVLDVVFPAAVTGSGRTVSLSVARPQGCATRSATR
jgi:hypothetical protein